MTINYEILTLERELYSINIASRETESWEKYTAAFKRQTKKAKQIKEAIDKLKTD